MDAIVKAQTAANGFGEKMADILATRDLPVTTDEEKEFAAMGVRFVKDEYEQADGLRRVLVDPLNKHVRDVNDMFRPYREACLEAERVLKNRIAGYVEQKRLENDRAVEKAAAAATAEQAESALSLVRTVEMPSGTSMSYRWVATITDEALLPREYLTPSMDKILRAVRDSDGAVQIPGVSVHQEPVVSSRRTR